MKHILYSTFLFFCFHSFAQDLNLSQQYSFGGSGYDQLLKTIRLSNGNYILAGVSSSPLSGTKTEAGYGLIDWWIVCLDANYNELWQKTMGGTLDDYMSGVKELSNGDLLVYGFSNSSNTGNKQSITHGSNDYWVVRMTNSGTVVWDKTYGGSDVDNASNLLELSSGNIIVSGSSNSPVSGNKTVPSYGFTDVWVLKLDPDGNILTQAVYGGSNYDSDYSMLQYGNDGLFLAANSISGVSGNKTIPNLGGDDAWIIKIDTSLNIINQYVVGGNSVDYPASFIQLDNGNFLLTFISSSTAGGMKTENGYGSNDVWLVELDTDFNVVRDKTIGGNVDEYIYNTYQLDNGNILLPINTGSASNSLKSENNMGASDSWLVVLDENWNIAYENTIGSSGADGINEMIRKSNGEVVFFGNSNGGINNDKTCNTNGQNDFWVVTAQTDLSVNSNILSTESIYPNPTESTIQFKTTEMNNDPYQVLDISGKVLMEGIVNKQQIDLSELHSGTYFISLNNNQYKVVKL
ncbi:T9SS type A sorting domain-containing protein [Fluviicola chungangensis]|uniref:T9SS type A sorting domain-containing protein n=1 Tax=Fluviicola chungangensis TaxID=2597671 RepID=A0A556MQJ1_9FLAO|nr:T9SS type A sorting domain-containing protein [Fluviicola chungangensis]TSJ42019.1 T9SS type A sorting domain-containing protein [Fluviicola chungangensis]